jgi:site-specific DNA-methyltransferase (adenine-specific)
VKPYYSHAGITIYHGDCREVLRELEYADVVMTDPVWPNCPEGLLQGWDNPSRLLLEMQEALCGNPLRLVVILRHDCDPRFLVAVNSELEYARTVQLPYVMPGYIGRWLGGDELAYCFGIPIPSRDGQKVIPGRAPAVQPDGRAANGHPCSRALSHMEFLVRWWSEPENLILDPFCGSGTTLEAAKNQKRRAIGIEIEEKYCEIAAKRLSQEVFEFEAKKELVDC